MARTRITVDYERCGDGKGEDPRECGLCLRTCEPAVFLLHQTMAAVEDDPFNPEKWRVTPLWPSLCTRCGECVAACPRGAISVSPLDQVARLPAASETWGPERGVVSPSGARDFERCLVIGGAGMLGFEIAKRLAAEGKTVHILDLQAPPSAICEAHRGDIRHRADVAAALVGLGPNDVVFQCAAAVWEAGTPDNVYEEVNIGGNRVVVELCRELGIGRLVYTSTIDVVVDGRRPIVDGDESLPYPRRLPKDAYSRTKILAEQLVLGAASPELAICALRPVGMYGPRDRYHLGNVIAMAEKGNRLRLGNGSARFSHAYSENVAHAHILAARYLFPGSRLAGRTYFIGDHYPAENFFDFMEPFLRALDLPVPRRAVPYPVAYGLAWLAERFAPHSNFNRFAVVQTCVDHTYRHDLAERDFQYEPPVSREEAFRRTLADLSEKRNA